MQIITGENQETLTQRGISGALQSSGVNPENANAIAFGIDGMIPLLMGVPAAQTLIKSSSKRLTTRVAAQQINRTGAAKGAPKYLYHYTSREAAQSISQSGLRVGWDGFSYLTNNSALKPLQAQIELAPPANRALPNSLLRINTTGLNPAVIRRVQGNLPGLGADGGTEFLFNQHIPASTIKIIR